MLALLLAQATRTDASNILAHLGSAQAQLLLKAEAKNAATELEQVLKVSTFGTSHAHSE